MNLYSTPRVNTLSPEDIEIAERPSTRMLLALADTGKHLYQGTVPGHVKAKRRARNKVARASRRANRCRSRM